MKRCLTSLIIREMQIKTIMRYHLISVRISKKTRDNIGGQGCGEKGTLIDYGKLCGVSPKIKK